MGGLKKKKSHTSVFVGGLSNEIKEKDLESEFEKIGMLKNIWIASEPPGFAFIEFTNYDDAKTACYRMNGTELLGSKLRVEISRKCGISCYAQGGGSRSKDDVDRGRKSYNIEGGDGFYKEKSISSNGYYNEHDFIQQSSKVRYYKYNYRSKDHVDAKRGGLCEEKGDNNRRSNSKHDSYQTKYNDRVDNCDVKDRSHVHRSRFYREKDDSNERSVYNKLDYIASNYKGYVTDSTERKNCNHENLNSTSKVTFYKTRIFTRRRTHSDNYDDNCNRYNRDSNYKEGHKKSIEVVLDGENCSDIKTVPHKDNGFSRNYDNVSQSHDHTQSVESEVETKRKGDNSEDHNEVSSHIHNDVSSHIYEHSVESRSEFHGGKSKPHHEDNSCSLNVYNSDHDDVGSHFYKHNDSTMGRDKFHRKNRRGKKPHHENNSASVSLHDVCSHIHNDVSSHIYECKDSGMGKGKFHRKKCRGKEPHYEDNSASVNLYSKDHNDVCSHIDNDVSSHINEHIQTAKSRRKKSRGRKKVYFKDNDFNFSGYSVDHKDISEHGGRDEFHREGDCSKKPYYEDNILYFSRYFTDYNADSCYGYEHRQIDRGRDGFQRRKGSNQKNNGFFTSENYNRSSIYKFGRGFSNAHKAAFRKKTGNVSRTPCYNEAIIPGSSNRYNEDYNYGVCHSYKCDCNNINRFGSYEEKAGNRSNVSSRRSFFGSFYSYKAINTCDYDFVSPTHKSFLEVIERNRLISSSTGQVSFSSVDVSVEYNSNTNKDDNKLVFQETECDTLEKITKQDEGINYDSSETALVHTELQKWSTSVRAEHLPDLVLRHIFSFLCLEDLLSIQKVCTSWCSATMESFVWKNAPVDLDLYGLEILQSLPYVHTVFGSFQNANKLLDALLNNVEDVREVDWVVCSSYSNEKFNRFIHKFENLEHITLHNNIIDFLQSLEILSTRLNLKKLSLLYRSNLENFRLGCRIIENGFFALTSLNLTRKQGEGGTVALSSMLEIKIHQLKELKLYDEICPNVLKLIFKSKKLEKFELRIFEWPEILLDMGCMTSLKSLNIEVLHDFPQSSVNGIQYQMADVYRNIIFPPYLEYFEIQFPCMIIPHFGIISNVISSLPHLRSLTVSNIDDIDLNQQLKNISSLQDLQTVSFYCCKTLTTEGVYYILKCPILTKFEVSHIYFTNSIYECLKNCTYMGILKLHQCVLNPDKLLEAILKMKRLTHIYTYDCKYFNERNEFINFDHNIINSMLRMCKHEKHYVKIY